MAYRCCSGSKVILQDMFPQKSIGKALAGESEPESFSFLFFSCRLVEQCWLNHLPFTWSWSKAKCGRMLSRDAQEARGWSQASY